MKENKDMFTQEAIEGAKRFLQSKDLLDEQGKEIVKNSSSIPQKINESNQKELIKKCTDE